MLQRRRWPICRVDRYLTYTTYFKYHQNMLLDYYWDNCDGQIPEIGSYKFRLPFAVRGTLLPPNKLPDGDNTDRNGEKIIAYAGYFQQKYIMRLQRSRLFVILHAPVSFFYTTIPAHLGRDHAVLRVLNYEIAFLAQKQKTTLPAYMYNDGITPISSSLSLSPDGIQMLNKSNETNTNPKLQTTVSKVRLFQNIDHIMFIDGCHQLGAPKNMSDQFSPTERPRPIFAWLLSDIMD